jgi:RNA polymerase sigma-70 factor, ECF subfamily
MAAISVARRKPRRMRMESGNDDLLARAVQGDRDAMESLLKRYGPAARRAIAGRIPRRFQAVLSEDDVLQQTLADAARGISHFRSLNETSLTKWLEMIARRNLSDAKKALGALKRPQPIDPGAAGSEHCALIDWVSAGGAGPSTIAGTKGAVADLLRAIEQLPAHYATAVRMYFIEELPIETVAAAMQKSQGAVFMLLARARDQLRDGLGPTWQYFSTSA